MDLYERRASPFSTSRPTEGRKLADRGTRLIVLLEIWILPSATALRCIRATGSGCWLVVGVRKNFRTNDNSRWCRAALRTVLVRDRAIFDEFYFRNGYTKWVQNLQPDFMQPRKCSVISWKNWNGSKVHEWLNAIVYYFSCGSKSCSVMVFLRDRWLLTSAIELVRW